MWFCYSETLTLLTNDGRPRGVALFSAKAQKEAFACKFHHRLLPQHQAAVCIHQQHLGIEKGASVSFPVSLYPCWGAAYLLVCLVSSEDRRHLQVLKYSDTQMLSLGILKGTKGDRTTVVNEKQMQHRGPSPRCGPEHILQPFIPTRQMAHGHPALPVSLGQKRENSVSNTELAANGLRISNLQLKPMRR